MAAQLKAGKQRIHEPVVGWEPHDDRRIVFYSISRVKSVTTTAGTMERVNIRLDVELVPNQDIAAHIGWVASAIGDPGAGMPELWFWDGRYWLKARVPGKGDWYSKGDYLLYEVVVVEPDGFIERLHAERQEIVNAK